MREIEFTPLDEHMARKMSDLAGLAPEGAFFHAVRLVCHVTANGHVCLDLMDFAGREVQFSYLDSVETVSLPETGVWVHELESNPLVGEGTKNTPFVLDTNHCRLYLRRYWQYERYLVTAFKQLSAVEFESSKSATTTSMTEQLFADTKNSEEQKLATQLALQSQLCIITGGPGTGKTTTIVNIMAMLLADNPEFKIVLTAPTGKAAARLSESVSSGKQRLLKKIPQDTWEKISVETQTIHRLLKSRRLDL